MQCNPIIVQDIWKLSAWGKSLVVLWDTKHCKDKQPCLYQVPRYLADVFTDCQIEKNGRCKKKLQIIEPYSPKFWLFTYGLVTYLISNYSR